MSDLCAPLQPALHDLLTLLRAPAVLLGSADGQLDGTGAVGCYVGDRRALRTAVFAVDRAQVLGLGHRLDGPDSVRHLAAVRGPGDDLADPTVLLRRDRRMTGDGFDETLELVNHATGAVTLACSLTVDTDLVGMDRAKSGLPGPAVAPTATAPDAVSWVDAEQDVTMQVAGSTVAAGADVRFEWIVHLEPGGTHRTDIALRVRDLAAAGFAPLPPRGAAPWAMPAPNPADPRLAPLLHRALADLDGLRMADPDAPEDTFLAAGSPWFLTLFGRDSLITASLLLPLDTTIAAGTLRTLGRRLGTVDDPSVEEAPGKVLHELRRADTTPGDRAIPARYYGTVDATALWIRLLHDAWRAGMPEHEVRDLLPALHATLGWLRRELAGGFVTYRGSAGSGLSNQGWKDSGDGVRWADGRQATRPLALCEVQGYAHAALRGAADLLDAYSSPGSSGPVPDELRTEAAALADRFRAAFWVGDGADRYPAIALDADGRAVDGPASNMGHLLGTGLLSPDEAAIVAARLAGPGLNSGFGLRTLSSDSAAYNPLSYHCGSVWPHDTALAVLGLAADGFDTEATALATGLVDAAGAFDNRLPELFAGTSADDGDPLAVYPASCRPQAWAAAAGVAVALHLGRLRRS